MNVTTHITDTHHGPVEELHGTGGAIAVDIAQDDLPCDACPDGRAVWHIGRSSSSSGGRFCERDRERAFTEANGGSR